MSSPLPEKEQPIFPKWNRPCSHRNDGCRTYRGSVYQLSVCAIFDDSKVQSSLSETALKANKLLITKREQAIKPLKRFKKSIFQELCEFHKLSSTGTIQEMTERLVQKVIVSL